MRVLFFCHYFPPEVNAPATRTYEHARRWVAAGHQVTVVTCVPNCPDGVVFEGYRSRLSPQIERVDGIRVIRVWTWLAPNAGTVRRIANYVSFVPSAVLGALRSRRPDVVVATSPQFFCAWAGWLAARLLRVPFVLEIRDIWPESIVAVGALGNRLLLRTLEWLERRLYRNADHVVAVGDGYRQQIEAKVPLGDRIDVVTNGVDLAGFAPRAPDARLRQEARLGQRFVCAYVGTIGMAHGLDVTLEAARCLRAQGREDIVLWLVGDGAARRRLAERACEDGLTSLIRFAGLLPKAQMPAVLATADACLIHLKGTALFATVIPSKLFEALAMERPVVLGVDGQARQILEAAGGGLFVQPEDGAALAAALIRLADDRALCRRLGRSGRVHVTQHYDRDLLAARYVTILERVLARRSA